MARKVFGFLAHGFAKPCTDERAVGVVVVNPALVAGVVRRVNVDALDPARVRGQQAFQRQQMSPSMMRLPSSEGFLLSESFGSTASV